MNKPTYAIVAITLNCNSRCIMCNIWQNRITNELAPKEFLKLPSSLTDINITGGEPFLRRDIVEIVRNIKKAAPNARLVLNTNGFMPHKIGPDMKEIIKIDPKFAFRVSIDGMGEAHDKIRKIPGGFNKIMKTLDAVRALGVKDLGVSFTLGNYNMDELPKVQDYCRSEKLSFSLTVTTGSVIYFGKDKASYRPTDTSKLTPLLQEAAQKHLESMSPREIVRGWFVKRMLDYLISGKRTLMCDAGSGFFYMDSVGNVYTCHMKPWIMGNIRSHTMKKILSNHMFDAKVHACNDCWMVCTAKSMMKKQLYQVAVQAMKDKVMATIASS
jgi:radical SAM protein with 4Fe4S-binding SPASM domain